MNKKLTITSLILSASALVIAAPKTYAHTFEQDGATSVELHVAPVDEPTAGSPATLQFEVQNTERNFSFDGCDCRAKISLDDQEIATVAVTTDTVSFVFDKPGTYDVVFSGTPQATGKFEPFSVDFDDVKVNPASQAAGGNGGVSPFYQAVILALVGIGLMLTIVLTVLYRKKR